MTSAIDVEWLYALGESEGYSVESAEGSIGWVEEVWLGERRTPQALAMRTVDDPPRLTAGPNGRPSASWTTTGRTQAVETEWPLWKAVAVLYCTIALLLALMITLAFTIAWAVAGTAY
jgi:hypothetical protein